MRDLNLLGISYYTLRTVVTDRPLLMRVSAIQPPMFAENAIVNHGSTQSNPDSVRLNLSTCILIQQCEYIHIQFKL